MFPLVTGGNLLRGVCVTSILLNTMPKSGSVYLSNSLAKIVGCELMYIGNMYALIDQISFKSVRKFSEGAYVSQNHLAPSMENIQILRHFGQKTILRLRDPRQALLSWIYHLDRITGQNDVSEHLFYFVPRTPLGYFDLSLLKKIDWQIDNYFPQVINWVEKWVELADSGTLSIHITHQDDLRTNERALFDSILEFYGLDISGYELPDLPKNEEETHFRRADPMEWRETFSLAQVRRATKMIPAWMMKRFGWEQDPGFLDRLKMSFVR